ncbi:hypothetical protein Tco_1373370, partial [Tanacetum coccineum]
DDPYMEVRHAYLATITDFESEPFKDSRETKIPQPLPIASSPISPSDDPYLIVRQAHTPITINTESKLEEAPSEIEEFQPLAARTAPASSDSTTPLSPSHPLTQTASAPTLSRPSYYRRTARMAVRTQPAMSSGLSTRLTKAMTLSPLSFRKRYRSSYETPSPSSSLTLPIRKRYRGISELVEDTKDESSDLVTEGEGSKDEGPGSEDKGPGSEDNGPSLEEEEEEGAAPESQQQAVPIMDTAADELLGLGYRALKCRELALGECLVPSTFKIGQSSRSALEQQRVEETHAPRPSIRATWVDLVDGIVYTDILIYVSPVHVTIQTPPSPEWSSGSLPVSPSSPAIPTLVASPATTLAATIAVDEDEFLEVGAQLELYWSILYDHTQCLDVLPPALFEGYDRDLRELYTRSREVRDEIFSQLLALESWNTTMQCELQDLRDHVTILEQEGSHRGQESAQMGIFWETLAEGNEGALHLGISPTDNLIENLTNILALLTQSYKTYLPQTNNQLKTSSNTRNQATVQDGGVVVQNVQGQQNRGQGNNARGRGVAGYGGAQNRVGTANPDQARQIKVALDEEQLLFIAGGQDNAIDEDVDEQHVQDLAFNVDNVFQADECDAFDFDVGEAPTAQTMSMANLSSAD